MLKSGEKSEEILKNFENYMKSISSSAVRFLDGFALKRINSNPDVVSEYFKQVKEEFGNQKIVSIARSVFEENDKLSELLEDGFDQKIPEKEILNRSLRESTAEAMSYPLQFWANREKMSKYILEEKLKENLKLIESDLNKISILKDFGVQVEGLNSLKPIYKIENGGEGINPYKIEEEAMENFLEFCNLETNGKKKNKRRISFADEILKESQKADLEDWRKEMKPEPSVEDEIEVLSLKDYKEQELVQMGTYKQLIKTMDGLALNKNGDYKEKLDSFKMFLRNWDPDIYKELLENENSYTIKLENDLDSIAYYLSPTGSCLHRKDLIAHSEDPFTLVMTANKNGEKIGYSRNFIVKDGDQNLALGVDTVEVDHKRFDKNRDVIKALGLADIQLGLDLGMKYIIGNESRVKFGLRQGYGNTKRSIKYYKPGRSVVDYSFNSNSSEKRMASTESYVLIENPEKFGSK